MIFSCIHRCLIVDFPLRINKISQNKFAEIYIPQQRNDKSY